MTRFHRSIAACLCAGLLASCGGEAPPPATAQPRLLASVTASAPARTAADYNDLLQRIYVAYFGRPADPGGQAFYATAALNAGSPTVVAGINPAYGSNPGVKFLIDSFATSAESQALYPGDNTTFINAIYRNLFNRDAEAGGRDFWANAINAGLMTRASAAINIMAGAQGTDLDLVNAKNTVATLFTASLNTDTRRAAYSGLDANVVVRNMLAGITLATSPASYQASVDATIATLVANFTPPVTYAQVAPIIQSRCVGCHSQRPTIGGFNPAPLGIRFDTEAQIRADAERIYFYVVVDGSMPWGNLTGMTEAERTVIANWHAAGNP
ncbi:MAG: DUF4214 domain-containing protein [Pseudomonadota bacterium]